jgi:hypothetical protein
MKTIKNMIMGVCVAIILMCSGVFLYNNFNTPDNGETKSVAEEQPYEVFEIPQESDEIVEEKMFAEYIIVQVNLTRSRMYENVEYKFGEGILTVYFAGEEQIWVNYETVYIKNKEEL